MMDFGPEPVARPAKKPKLNGKKTIFMSAVAILVIAGIVWLFLLRPNNPLPPDIKNQVGYKVVYPSTKTGSLGQTGYQYQAGQKTLAFTVKSNTASLVFAESPAPSSLGTGDQVSFSAIGLHPYAQFQSKFGPVALVNFYQSGNLKPAGQSAVLAASGTLVIIHSDKNLANEQWKDLINSLKITK